MTDLGDARVWIEDNKGKWFKPHGTKRRYQILNHSFRHNDGGTYVFVEVRNEKGAVGVIPYSRMKRMEEVSVTQPK